MKKKPAVKMDASSLLDIGNRLKKNIRNRGNITYKKNIRYNHYDK